MGWNNSNKIAHNCSLKYINIVLPSSPAPNTCLCACLSSACIMSTAVSMLVAATEAGRVELVGLFYCIMPRHDLYPRHGKGTAGQIVL